MFLSVGKGERGTVKNTVARLNLSARSYHRTIKVARTIADLDGSEHINDARRRSVTVPAGGRSMNENMVLKLSD